MPRVWAWGVVCALSAVGAFAQGGGVVFADGFEVGSTCIWAATVPDVAGICPYLSPLWLPDICASPAVAESYVSDTTAVLDSGINANCTAVVTQTGGPEVCVIRAKSIALGGSLTVNGPRAIAFVADSSLSTDGTIDVAAHATQSGPGGGARVSGGAPTSTGGGGGAGFATDGGAGGSGSGAGTGAAGGSAVAPLDLPDFEGGARGAPGSGFLDPDGGGGGGGLLLVACKGWVTTRGTIQAGGGGGAGAFDTTAGALVIQSNSAGGGGAGGYVVIQGLALDIGGSLFANGGGGGGGNSLDDGAGGAGSDGTGSTSPASGGAGGGTGGMGGGGGSRDVGPTNGSGSGLGASGGGGGGSAGVLQLCIPAGVAPVVQPSVVTSPELAPLVEVPTNG